MSLLTRMFDLYTIIPAVLMLFTCMPVRAYAQAWVATKCGDDTPRQMGRLTLNPLKHLDLFGSIALILFRFGWTKPLPIQRRNFKNYKRDSALVAAAGPISTFLMAFILTIVLRILNNVIFGMGVTNGFVQGVYIGIQTMVSINLWLTFLSLLPFPPFDGGVIISSLLPGRVYYKVSAFFQKYQGIITVAVLVLFYMGILSIPISFLSNLTFQLFWWLCSPIDMLFGIPSQPVTEGVQLAIRLFGL
ncbi:MAG: site-2 protease family protein [Oscillospiraceae bacterium]